MAAWTPEDIDRLTAVAVAADLAERDRRRQLIGALPRDLAATLPESSRPADQLRGDLTALAHIDDDRHRVAWLARAENIVSPTHPVEAHLFARYAVARHALLAGAAGEPAPTWVKAALIQAEQIVRRGLGRAHAVDRVVRFEAGDGGLVLRHLGHFVGGPPIGLLWLHLAGQLVNDGRRLRLRTADPQGMRLDELAEDFAATAAETRVVLIDVDPATEPGTLAKARALDWGPATLCAIGPGLTAALAAALEGGARTAGELRDQLGEHAKSDSPALVLAAGGEASAIGDADELAAVVGYIEAVRARCQQMPLRQRDAKVRGTDGIYVPLYTSSPADGEAPDDKHRARRLLRAERTERPPQTVHDRVAEHRCLFIVGEPGSGKTTTLRRLCAALCDAHLARDDAARPAWMPERPLPVWLDLRDLPPPPDGAKCRARDLLTFAFAHLDRCDDRQPLAPAVADEALREGRLVLILDGLDEVPSPALRRAWADAITTLATTQARRARVWVSCREAARAAGAEPGHPFVRVDLQPFDRNQRLRVIAGWLRSRIDAPGQLAQESEALLADLARHPEVERQTGSPLILAMVCLLYFRGRRLPDSRVDLYHQLIGLFLNDRERDETPTLVDVEPHTRRMVLTDLAYTWWVESATHAGGSADQPAGLLHDRCVQIIAAGLALRRPDLDAARCHALAVELVAFFDLRAGMLRWDGDDPATGQRRLNFAHRTFAEYLVACRLSQDKDVRERHQTERYARDANWREVFVMFTALVGRAETGEPGPAWEWVKTLGGWAADVDRPAPDRACYARLAAECLAPCRDRPPPAEVVEAVDGLQATLLDAERCAGFPAVQRVGFWQAIGPHNRLVADATLAERWMHLPGGRFWRGAGDGDELAWPDERPAGWVEVTPFAMQRWPVLVMEYAAFVEHGYDEHAGARPPWWSSEGWAWRVGERVDRPEDWFRQRQGRPTHPVVGVSYHEAEAYAAWLGHTGQGPGPGEVALPSEAQWERAARGTGPESARRRYPWGWDDEPERRNGHGAHDGTTPIGAFPGGCTIEGLWSMSGNVWEWCIDGSSDALDPTPYSSTPPVDSVHRITPQRGVRVLRGGAWRSDSQDLRVSFRIDEHPARRDGDFGFRCVWRRAPRSLGA